MSVSVRQMLVASKNYKIKCPYTLEPEGWCVHNTYNDASANNEVQYMILNQNQVSFHYAVDDKEVVQGLPTDRNAWAAGDGGQGPGNRKYLHLEICYSKSGGERYTKAEENAVKFLAAELKKRGWGIDKVKKHQDFSGKYCPHRILDEKRWTSFLQRIEKEMKPVQNGWVKTEGIWYFFKEGKKHTGWLQYKNKWYYLEPSEGKMVTGLQTIGTQGKKYYFLPNGDLIITDKDGVIQ